MRESNVKQASSRRTGNPRLIKKKRITHQKRVDNMMKISNLFFVMLHVQIVVFFMLPGICNGAENTNLFMSAEPSKEEIFSGEPILLLVSFKNRSDQNVGIDCGPGYRIAFAIEICDKKDRTICKRGVQIPEGLSPLGRMNIPAASTVQIQLILNRWCSTSIPEGQYKIRCRFEPIEAPSIKPIDACCDLRVVKPDEGKLGAIISNLTESAISNTNENNQLLAYEMVSLSDSPIAVQYQSKLVRMTPNKWRFMAGMANPIDGLRKIGSPEAIKQLVSICDDTSLNKNDRESALSTIRALRKSGDTNILQATEAIINKYKKVSD